MAEAAIVLLIERGWAAVTAVEVCERVGVSRGAFHHHYDSVSNLLADALGRLYADMVRKKRPTVVSLVGAVDGTWAAISNPRFKAVIEAWLAMANDPGLRAQIGPVVAGFASLVNPDRVIDVPSHRDFFITARETMLGLALGRAANGKPLGHERRVLARLRAEAAALDSQLA